MTESQTYYVGPQKVVAVTVAEIKTPKGEEVVKIMFESNPTELMAKSMFEEVVTEIPIDYTTLRARKHKKTLEDLAAVLLERNLQFGDLSYICKELANKIQDAFERASSLLWTKDDKQWVPGVSYLNDRSLLEVETVLKTIKNDTPEQSTAGGEGSTAITGESGDTGEVKS